MTGSHKVEQREAPCLLLPSGGLSKHQLHAANSIYWYLLCHTLNELVRQTDHLTAQNTQNVYEAKEAKRFFLQLLWSHSEWST